MKESVVRAVVVALLSLAGLVACPQGGPGASKVTGVRVSANVNPVASGSTSTLVAAVSGEGGYSRDVTWAVVSGGGSLSSTDRKSVV